MWHLLQPHSFRNRTQGTSESTLPLSLQLFTRPHDTSLLMNREPERPRGEGTGLE